MRSLRYFGKQSVGVPLLADDVLEFHAARLLLLFKLCGQSGRIDGLTKMAKLDFFVRYPQFFNTACAKLNITNSAPVRHIESSMIRYHYGPWDERYYHILAYLEAKQLIGISPKGNMYQLRLTDYGNRVAVHFEKDPAFSEVVKQMRQVKTALGAKAGSALKKLVYQLFEDEVAKRPLGEVID
jgi:hypothetical protein